MANADMIIGVQFAPDYAQLIKEGQRAGQVFNRSLGRITTDARQFRQAFDAATARVISFAASTSAIFAVNLAIQKLITSTVQLEKSLAEINVLFRLGNKDLVKFAGDLFSVANKTGTSFSDTAKAAQEFSRQGLSAAETLKRVEAALTLTRLSGLNLETSVASLTAVINSFSKESLTAIEIVNRLATVDAKFAVSSADLAEALKRVGSTAEDAGVSLNQVLGLVTAAQQVTARGGAVIGNAFKTIFTRLQRPQVLEDLENAGVRTRDLQGKTLPLIEVLENLSRTYDSLSSAQKSFVAETVGSVYQINILKAILGDLGSGASIYRNALDTASTSTSEAERRVQELNKTISTQLVQTFNNLSKAAAGVGTIVIQPTIKGGLDVVNALLDKMGELANTSNEGFSASITQGIGKGISNLLTGPGIQLAVFGLAKLFIQLGTYVKGIASDLTGLNTGIKEREILENKIISYLTKQKDIITLLKTGQTSLQEAAHGFASEIMLANKEMRDILSYSKAIAGNISRPVGKPTVSIPNLTTNTAIREALSRENRATGGNAVLSQSSALISSTNPLGLAAIDKRTQKSADDAIAQHLMLGQNIFQIKKSGVPSLATNDSSILGGFTNPLDSILLSTILGGISGANLKKPSATKALDEWVKAVEQAREQVVGGKSVSVNDTRQNLKVIVSNVSEFDRVVGPHLEKTRNEIAELNQIQKNQNSRIQGFGLRLAVGGSFGGGLASQFLGKSNPNLGAATDELTSGLVSAGQVLSVFQGTAGKAAASIIAINGLVNGLDIFSKKIESQRRALEQQESRTQKFSSSIDGAIGSLSNLNSLYLDSSASLEVINREQQKLANSLALLASSSPEGRRLVSRVNSTSDTSERIRGLGLARELENRKLSESAGLFQIAELGAQRTLFGKFAGLSGGIFGGESSSKRLESLSIIQGNANNIINSLTSQQRDSLVSSLENAGQFQGNLNQNSVARQVISTIKSSGGTDSDIGLLVNQVRLLINNLAANDNPTVQAIIAAGRRQSSQAQTDVDLSTRNVAAFRRLFLNSGSLLADNEFDVRASNTRGTLNSSIVRDAQRRAESSSFAFLNGDRTVAANDLSIEIGRIEAEKQSRLSTLRNQAGRNIFAAFGQNVDILGKGFESNVQNSIVNPQNREIGQNSEALLRSLNQGLATVSKEDFGQFLTPEGGFDFKSFEDKVVNASGGNQNISDQIRRFLETNRGSQDILKEIKDLTNQEVELNQDQLKEQQIATAKFNAMIKELDTRRQANFLGGTRALTDRDFRRETERRFIRGGRLLQSGQTIETQARGAAEFLQALKDLGRDPLTIASKDARGRFVGVSGNQESQLVARALNIVTSGLQRVQEQSVTRIGQSLGRGGAGALARSQLFIPLVAQRRGLDNLASTAVSSAFKPEGDTSIQASVKDATNSFSLINTELTTATERVQNFGDTIGDVGIKLRDAIKELDTARNNQKTVNENVAATVEAAVKRVLRKDTPRTQEDNQPPTASNVAKLIQGGVLTAGGLGVAALLTGRQRRQEIIGNIKDNFSAARGFINNNALVRPFGLGVSLSEFQRNRRNRGFAGNEVLGPPIPNNLIPRKVNEFDIVQSALQGPPQLGQLVRPGRPLSQYSVNPDGRIVRAGPLRLASRNDTFNDPGYINQRNQEKAVYEQSMGIYRNPQYRLQQGRIFNVPFQDRIAKGILPPPIPFGRGGFSSRNVNLAGGFSTLTKSFGNSGASIYGQDRYQGQNVQTAFGNYPPLSYQLQSLESEMKKNQVAKGGINTSFGRKGNAGFISTEALKRGGQFLGTTALGVGGGIAGSVLGQSLTGDQYGIGGLLGGVLGSSAAAVASPAVLGGLAAGAVAFGGFKGGNALYRSLNKDTFAGLNEGTSEAFRSTSELVSRQLKSGKSSDEIKKIIDAQIASTQRQITTAGGGGFFSSLIGLGGTSDNLKQAVDELKQLRDSIEAQKEQIDAAKKAEDFQTKMLAALEKIAGGGGDSKATIQVEISLKDADKLPDIFNTKIIKPLEEQIRGLQNRVLTTEQRVGVNPNPSSV